MAAVRAGAPCCCAKKKTGGVHGGRRGLGQGRVAGAMGERAQGAWNGCAGEGRCPWEGAASLEKWSSAAMEFLLAAVGTKEEEKGAWLLLAGEKEDG
jgi:hypothetical protein